MTVGLIVLGALLGIAAAGSGVGKLVKVPAVMQSMAAVGVPLWQIPVLAVLEIAGAFGLLLGIWNKPLGVTAAVCLAFYFLGAVVAHLRKRHGGAEFGPAAAIFVIAVAVAVLEISR